MVPFPLTSRLLHRRKNRRVQRQLLNKYRPPAACFQQKEQNYNRGADLLSNNKDIYPSLRVADLVGTTGFGTTTTTNNNSRCTKNNNKCWLPTRTRNQSLFSLFPRRTRFSSAFNMPFSYMLLKVEMRVKQEVLFVLFFWT